MKIAVIPARGGSKRIPRKNIKHFCDKPMIAWSIEAAKSSGLFEHIIVSTDDAEIAKVARHWGAEVPFMRPDELSNDYAGTIEVIAHATQWALDQGFELDAVCCIYATAPFVQVDDIKRGWEALDSGNWDYAFTVTDFAAPIFRSFKQTDEGGIEMFFPEYFVSKICRLRCMMQGNFTGGVLRRGLKGNGFLIGIRYPSSSRVGECRILIIRRIGSERKF
jgi:pseudaminic acid cytidylyltransferase